MSAEDVKLRLVRTVKENAAHDEPPTSELELGATNQYATIRVPERLAVVLRALFEDAEQLLDLRQRAALAGYSLECEGLCSDEVLLLSHLISCVCGQAANLQAMFATNEEANSCPF